MTTQNQYIHIEEESIFGSVPDDDRAYITNKLRYNKDAASAEKSAHRILQYLQGGAILETIAVTAFAMSFILTYTDHQFTNLLSLAHALHLVTIIIILIMTFMSLRNATWKSASAKTERVYDLKISRIKYNRDLSNVLMVVEFLNMLGGAFAFFTKLFWENLSYTNGFSVALGGATKVEVVSFIVTCVAFVVAIIQLINAYRFKNRLRNLLMVLDPKNAPATQPVVEQTQQSQLQPPPTATSETQFSTSSTNAYGNYSQGNYSQGNMNKVHWDSKPTKSEYSNWNMAD